MRQSSLKLALLSTTLTIGLMGCNGEVVSDETLFSAVERINHLLDSSLISSLLSLLPRVVPIALVAVGIGMLLFARSSFFRLHSALLAGALVAAILGIVGAIIGGFGAYTSIYAVNNYYERWVGSQGPIITVLGGALVGVIGIVAGIFIVILGYFLIAGLLSALTGSSVDVPIVDRWGFSTGISLRFWEPGDVGSEEGGLGCGLALTPGFLVAPIVGGYAAIRLAEGNALDISSAPWNVALICLLLVGFIGLLMGLRLGWVEGGGKGGATLTGIFYGFLFALFIMDVLVLFNPTTFLRIVTYSLCIATFAWVGSRLASK